MKININKVKLRILLNRAIINKYMFIIFFVFVYFINIGVLKAEEYTCAYDFTTETKGILQINFEYPIKLTFNTNPKSITYPDGIFDKKVYFLDKLNDSNYTDEYIVESLDGGCTPNIMFCVIRERLTTGEVLAYAIFYDESNFYNLNWKKNLLQEELYSLGKDYNYSTLDKSWCGIAQFNSDDSSGEQKDGNFGCDVFDEHEKVLLDLDCNEKECNAKQKKNYDNKLQQLKTFCNSVFQHANYGVSPCLNNCLKFQKDFSANNVELSECGLSDKLVSFIMNIIKWVKYIVPVAVIILGIIDFLRAIGSEKDDGLKKAQGRFIRRIIAAALIFIIPFILEFIIEKMGFISDTCGII